MNDGIVMAEAPIALGWTVYPNGEATVYPLTPCCGATGKGCDGYTGCRSCYEEVSPLFGDCWRPDGANPLAGLGIPGIPADAPATGWDTYKSLLRSYGRVDEAKAGELVAEARRQLEEVLP